MEIHSWTSFPQGRVLWAAQSISQIGSEENIMEINLNLRRGRNHRYINWRCSQFSSSLLCRSLRPVRASDTFTSDVRTRHQSASSAAFSKSLHRRRIPVSTCKTHQETPRNHLETFLKRISHCPTWTGHKEVERSCWFINKFESWWRSYDPTEAHCAKIAALGKSDSIDSNRWSYTWCWVTDKKWNLGNVLSINYTRWRCY